ncbi:hypothetical protein YTPLAS18_17820 [Nitrospira sp.]|nr:hypothetical protein YTPLAS18_17820 [Nitrospira sp.]
MPYSLEHEKAFLCIVAFVIVVLLYIRVRVARRRRKSHPSEPKDNVGPKEQRFDL